MPNEIKYLKSSSLILGRSNSTVYYQSGVAMIEEVNKENKKDVIGVPDENQWTSSFRRKYELITRGYTFTDDVVTKGETSIEERDKQR